ncbi:MAG: hypothetical protein J6S69_10725 [Proteobacteria bacterium]|nr:hypothetical protein [Pseudomonadota bacterium]
MAEIFDTSLLLALPASGKSEVRNFLTNKDPEMFHMGETIQLDDYPYVHVQLVIDEVLVEMGEPRIYHSEDDAGGRNGPFLDSFDWPALIELLNEDYHEILTGKAENPKYAAIRLFERLDSAAVRVGGVAKIAALSPAVRDKLEEKLEDEARELFDEKIKNVLKSREGKTIVIEFSRGGPAGVRPLPEHYGYAGSLPWLSPELLKRAAILYIWVTPEESRRKNRDRARPGEDKSILFHGTPESVMLQDYGSDDMVELMEMSDREHTLRIESQGNVYYVPVARFDNRRDLTTFARKDPSEWKAEEIEALDNGIRDTALKLWDVYKSMHS